MLSKLQARRLHKKRIAKYTERQRTHWSQDIPDDIELGVLPTPRTSHPSIHYDWNYHWQSLGFYRPGKLRTIRNNSLHHRQQDLVLESRLYQLALRRQIKAPRQWGLPRGMEVIMETEHLMIQKSRESGVRRNWFKKSRFGNQEILSSDGVRRVFAINYHTFFQRVLNCWDGQCFQYSFRVPDGFEVFRLWGKTNWFGFSHPECRVIYNGQIMGRAVRSGKFMTTKYSIYNKDRKLTFVAVPVPNYKPRETDSCWRWVLWPRHDFQLPLRPYELNIFSADMTVHVGRITRNWKKYYESIWDLDATADTSVHKHFNGGYFLNEIGWIQHGLHFGVSFPADLGPFNRALFLGVAFMLFHYYHDDMPHRTYKSHFKKLVWRPIKFCALVGPLVYLFLWAVWLGDYFERIRLENERVFNDSGKLLNLTL